MKKICFLTCQSPVGFVIDDELAKNELEKNAEYEVSSVAWDKPFDWSIFDLVIIRSTWDYFKRPDEFLESLKNISIQTKLMNSLDVAKWNMHKGYLQELENKGVRVVPMQMFKIPGKISVPVSWNYERYIIKPAISANAFKTIIVSAQELNSDSLLSGLHAGDWILQPYIEEIKKGEVSLHFFNKHFSHGILKTPKAGDFRVQEEHGGSITVFNPSQTLLAEATDLLNKIPFDLLYARVDLVKWRDIYYLMELELIEPALYFRTSAESVKNFKREVDNFFKSP